ncbi:MAG: MAPEG family protein [Gemmatimonadetes bacterium]|nr:MAPEG family protein [Gemmatimonadota bacterium]
MAVEITAFYAALLVAVLIFLTTRIGVKRAITRISILDGGNREVAVEMRRHGNFVEHVPLLIVLMAIVEINGGSPVFLHVVGITLVICRVAHPIGLRYDHVQTPLRMVGSVGTSLITGALGFMALWQGLNAI